MLSSTDSRSVFLACSFVALSWTLLSILQPETVGLSTTFLPANQTERRPPPPLPRSCDHHAVPAPATVPTHHSTHSAPSHAQRTNPPLTIACTPAGLAFAAPLARGFGSDALRVSVSRADPTGRLLVHATDLALVLRPSTVSAPFAADLDAIPLGVFLPVITRHPAPFGETRPGRILVPQPLWRSVRSCGILLTQSEGVPPRRVANGIHLLAQLRRQEQSRGVFALADVPTELEVLPINGIRPSVTAFFDGRYPFGAQVFVVLPRRGAPRLDRVRRFFRDGRGQSCLDTVLSNR